jgi:TRAP transporter TAXI family solute receptor
MKLNRRGLLALTLALPILPAQRAFATATQAAAPHWPTALLMATGRPGGAYAVYGPAWGRLAEQSSGVAIAYVASGGSATDILLIEQGAAQLGMTSVTVADQARTGTGAWTAGVKFDSFRALFPIFPSILQIVTKSGSAITSVSDLAGRSIGIGPDGGSGAVAVPGLLADLGIAPACCVTGDYLPQMTAMLAGSLDACAFIGAPPMPAIQLAAQHHALGFIGFTPEQTAQVTRSAPGMTAMTLPAGLFQNQTSPIRSVGTANFAIGAASLPDSLVTALTLAALRNRDKLAELVPAVACTPLPEMIGQGNMSFHPGAATALRSLGMEVPAKFVAG